MSRGRVFLAEGTVATKVKTQEAAWHVLIILLQEYYSLLLEFSTHAIASGFSFLLFRLPGMCSSGYMQGSGMKLFPIFVQIYNQRRFPLTILFRIATPLPQPYPSPFTALILSALLRIIHYTMYFICFIYCLSPTLKGPLHECRDFIYFVCCAPIPSAWHYLWTTFLSSEWNFQSIK